MIDQAIVLDLIHEILDKCNNGLSFAFNSDEDATSKFAVLVSNLTIIEDRAIEIKKLYEVKT